MSARATLSALQQSRRMHMATTPAGGLIFTVVVATLSLGSVGAHAQESTHDSQIRSGSMPIAESVAPEPGASAPGIAIGVMPALELGDDVVAHVLFNQLEGRTNGPDNELRWDMEAWIGTDMNKLVFKSEGFLENGKASDGITEVMYGRPLPFLRYFDAQVGVRYDLDSDPGRAWGAIGIEGLAPYFFQFEPTFYFSDQGHLAGRLNGSYDVLITNRLILQPQFELNFYSKSQPDRGTGSGLSELDTGLRLRYEISRKFAPYIGAAYAGKFGKTADLTRAEGGIVNDVRFVVGIRVWY